MQINFYLTITKLQLYKMLNMTKLKLAPWLCVSCQIRCCLLVRLWNECSYTERSLQFHTLPHGATSCTAHRALSAGPACPCARPLESLCRAGKRQNRISCTEALPKEPLVLICISDHFPGPKQVIVTSLSHT